MATLSQKDNDAVFHIDEEDDEDDEDQETRAEAEEDGGGNDDEDEVEASSDKVNESRFKTITDSIWSWSRPVVDLH